MSHRMASWNSVDRQDSSPLFNGRIPAEIRNLIFEFALAEHIVPALDRPILHDFFARDDHEKLDDESNMEAAPADQASDRGEDEDGARMPDVESILAPAVQGLSAQSLFRLQEMMYSWDWFRPGYTGRRKIHTALLRTCRKVYKETYMLPSQGSKIFYNARGPRWCPHSPSEFVSGLAPEAARQIRNLQLFPQMWYLESDFMDLVTGIISANSRRQGRHLVPVSNPRSLPAASSRVIPQGPFHLHHPGLLRGLPPQLPPVSAYSPGFVGPALWRDFPLRGRPEHERIRPWRLTEHVTSLRIYLRRTDWWDWENNTPLVISPFNSSATRPTLNMMQQSMRASFDADQQLEPHLRSSSPSPIPHWSCWGLLFLRMPNLKTLTIDFETSEDKKSEMDAIVDWAHHHWRFPVLRRLSGDHRDPYTFDHLQRCHKDRPVDLSPWSQDMDVLSAADEPVQKTSWRGLPHHFSGHCHACQIQWNTQSGTPDCAECTKKQRLLDLKKGPQLLVWTVNWKRKVPRRNPEPESNARGEGSRDAGEQPRESHIVAMLPEDAQHRTRRRRELDELMRDVTF